MKRWMVLLLALAALTGRAEIVLEAGTDRSDALYRAGEPAVFTVKAQEDGRPVADGEAEFVLTRDGGAELARQTVPLREGRAELSYRSDEPGFVLCAVDLRRDGKSVAQKRTAAGFSPEQIRQGRPEPADFDAFWAAGKAEAAQIPWDVQMTPAPELSTDTLDLYRISFANVDNTRLYGFLSVPKHAEGPFPAVVVIPGAAPAVNAPGNHMIEGVITLFLNVHAYEPLPVRSDYPFVDVTLQKGTVAAPVLEQLAAVPGVERACVWRSVNGLTTLSAEPADEDVDPGALAQTIAAKLGNVAMAVAPVRADLAAAQERRMLSAYGTGAYPMIGASARDKNFFRRAWLGMDRATEWLRQYPDFDGKNLGVCGWSQGGGSTLALAGLNRHFTFAVANQPALCDHGAAAQGRTPGWPFFSANFPGDDKIMGEVAYVDAANLARRITCPVIVLVGFTDGACHPGSVYAAFNNIPGPQKTIVNEPNTDHTWNDAYSQSIARMVAALKQDSRLE